MSTFEDFDVTWIETFYDNIASTRLAGLVAHIQTSSQTRTVLPGLVQEAKGSGLHSSKSICMTFVPSGANIFSWPCCRERTRHPNSAFGQVFAEILQRFGNQMTNIWAKFATTAFWSTNVHGSSSAVQSLRRNSFPEYLFRSAWNQSARTRALWRRMNEPKIIQNAGLNQSCHEAPAQRVRGIFIWLSRQISVEVCTALWSGSIHPHSDDYRFHQVLITDVVSTGFLHVERLTHQLSQDWCSEHRCNCLPVENKIKKCWLKTSCLRGNDSPKL